MHACQRMIVPPSHVARQMTDTFQGMTMHLPPDLPGPTRAARVAAFRTLRAAAALIPLALASCGPSVLAPEGEVGAADRTILLDSLAIMGAIVGPTILLALFVAWWYRASNRRARRMPDFVYSGRIELVVWAVPLMTIMLLGGVTWLGAHELDPGQPLHSKEKPLEVQAVSLDWKWLFIYPEQHIATVNQLVIPAGRPIHFSLSSASVMNAFFVPKLGSMIYTMNGMTSSLNLSAKKPGVFYGRSSHYSGDGFSGMEFNVRAVPPDAFATWVTTTKAAGPTLDRAAYTELEKQSQDVAPATYRDADPMLFHNIVAQIIPPAGGPIENNTAHADVSPKRNN
jgi:cytochrome o ubiquinol oxidase subunit 2